MNHPTATQKKELTDALRKIEATFHVKILFVSESGSRTWGFDNSNSDFDTHFIYEPDPSFPPLKKDNISPEDLLDPALKKKSLTVASLAPGFDLSGWSLEKTLHHAARSNPILWEWLESPMVHEDFQQAGTQMREAFTPFKQDKRIAGVHFSVADRNLKEMHKKELARRKRYFHIARPIFVCQWLQKHPGTLPPADFETLMNLMNPPAAVQAELLALLTEKRIHPFEERGPKLSALEAWAEEELLSIDAWIGSLSRETLDETRLQPFREKIQYDLGFHSAAAPLLAPLLAEEQNSHISNAHPIKRSR